MHAHFGRSMNLARIKALCMMVCALCKVRRVTYTKLASAFDSKASSGSSLRRIQRLIAECGISTNINILTLGIIYDGMAFPVVFKMMDKRGNSNTGERIGLIDRFARLAGKNPINHLVADREFIGSGWPGYLSARDIHYHIRMRENFRVFKLLPYT